MITVHITRAMCHAAILYTYSYSSWAVPSRKFIPFV